MAYFRQFYTMDEWRTLQFAPLWVFTAISAANKKVSKKEITALAKEISEAHLYKEPLVQEVLGSVGSDFESVFREYQADSRDVMRGLSDVADLLDSKAETEQAKNFKMAMLLMGRNIAEASGGGFLGMGKKMGDNEKAALVLVAAALRAV